MADLEPITRDEMLWSGEDVEPITRREMYIRHLYDETQVIPERPITREEMFILKAGEELHDVTIEQLNVSENGTYSESGKAYSPVIVEVPQPTITKLTATENKTYTAPSGTAYNEVDVDVPLPSNAYLLKDLSGLPADIATFTDGSSLPMPKLEVDIEPIQDLHGYDGPWAGGAGKNKFYIDLPHEEVSGSATYVYELTLKPNTAYTMSSNVPQDNPASLYFNGGTSYVNGVWNGTPRTFTSDENGNLTVYVRHTTIQGGIDLYTAVKNGTYYIQLEEGQTATSFAPYSNICPISGWSAVDVTIQDDIDNPTTTETITIQLGDTYYGGKLDVVSGVLTVDRAEIDLGSRTYNKAVDGYFYAYISDISIINFNANEPTAECEIYKLCTSDEWYGRTIDSGIFGVESSHVIYIADTRFSDGDSLKTALVGKKLVYTLATPQSIQLTPTQVNSLEGVNNISANSGKIINGQYFSKGE